MSERPEPVWTTEDLAQRDRVMAGECVVARLKRGWHPPLLAWAKEAGLYVRIDRRTVWGNPYTLPADGGRMAVVRLYEERHLPSRPDLLANIGSLRGRVLACWCAPLECHGDVLARLANHPERKRS